MESKMNWKYIKGSEKDFIGAPDWCTVVYKGTSTYVYFQNLDHNSELKILAQRELIPNWDGLGVPPVGTMCEYSLNDGGTWWNCKIDYIVGNQGVVMLCDVVGGAQYVDFLKYNGQLKFRPVRSEEEKKRDEAVEDMLRIFGSNAATGTTAALKAIYDAGYRKNG